jgi:hypothetical protein
MPTTCSVLSSGTCSPAIGGFPVDEIDKGLLLAALAAVTKRGAIETAHRLRQHAERVLHFAARAEAPNSNPAVNVRDTMKPVQPKAHRGGR